MAVDTTPKHNYTNIISTSSVDATKQVVLENIVDMFTETIDALPDAEPAQPVYYAITMNMNGNAAVAKEQFKYTVEATRDASYDVLTGLMPSQNNVDLNV